MKTIFRYQSNGTHSQISWYYICQHWQKDRFWTKSNHVTSVLGLSYLHDELSWHLKIKFKRKDLAFCLNAKFYNSRLLRPGRAVVSRNNFKGTSSFLFWNMRCSFKWSCNINSLNVSIAYNVSFPRYRPSISRRCWCSKNFCGRCIYQHCACWWCRTIWAPSQYKDRLIYVWWFPC